MAKAVKGKGTLPLFGIDSTWTAPTEPPNLEGVELLSVDTETHDPFLEDRGPGILRKQGHICGVSLASQDGAWYFPIAHAGGNCEWNVADWLQETLAHDRTYVFANAGYDAEALHSIDAVPAGTWVDVQVDEALLDEESPHGYSLEAIANKWLGIGKNDEELMKHAMHYGAQTPKEAKQMMKDLPAGAVGVYAEVDARRTIDVFLAQQEMIDAQGLREVSDLERRITPLCWQMRRNGIRFNREAAHELNARWKHQEEQMLLNIRNSGYRVDPWSSTSLGRYCDLKGLKYARTEAGAPSFTKDNFPTSQDPTLREVGQYRKLSKMRRDFIEKWLIASEFDGRIHSTWMQTASEEGGTRSGRFGCKNENLQQVPARDPDFGPIMRALFMPEVNETFMKGDYSGQEIRIAIHYAMALGCTDAHKVVAQYIADKKFDFHRMIADMARIERTPAKTLALGSLYGMSPRKSQVQLGFNKEESERVYNEYHRMAPYFQELATKAMQRAESHGYVRTFCGRRRHFRDGAFIHKALNSIVQGTAGDQAKTAMVNVWDELERVPLLQVHDELDYSIPDMETGKRIGEIMEEALPLHVPMYVEVKTGAHW